MFRQDFLLYIYSDCPGAAARDYFRRQVRIGERPDDLPQLLHLIAVHLPALAIRLDMLDESRVGLNTAVHQALGIADLPGQGYRCIRRRHTGARPGEIDVDQDGERTVASCGACR